MNFSILAQLDPGDLALSLLVGFVAGVVKGAVGFALPLIMISGLSTFLEPRLALAGLIVPVLITNWLQVFRTGWAPVPEALAEVWRYVLIVCVAILIFAQIVPLISQRLFYLILGVPVVALTVIQLVGIRLSIRPERRRRAEWMAASLSGFLGGFSGTWGPTTVLYLLAIDMPKQKQMIVQGIIYGAGGIALFAAHLYSGVLTPATGTFSTLLLIPALIGMWFGFQIQDRMNQEAFRRATLIMLTIAGANLIRRAIMG